MSATPERWVVDLVERNLNVRSVVSVSSVMLNTLGCLFVYHGIRDDGFIDVKTAVIEGHIKTGLVGIVIIFLGFLLSAILVLNTYSLRRTVEITMPNGFSVRVRGAPSIERTLRSIAQNIPGSLNDDASDHRGR